MLGRLFLEKVMSDFKNKGYNFKNIEQMNNITIAHEMYMSYDFYNKHNMHAVEWILSSTINKNKNLITKFNRNWRHPLNRKFEIYYV